MTENSTAFPVQGEDNCDESEGGKRDVCQGDRKAFEDEGCGCVLVWSWEGA